MAKNQQPAEKKPAHKTKCRPGRRNARHRTQTKAEMLAGITTDRKGNIKAVRPGPAHPTYVDEKDPVFAAQQAAEQHYKVCDRCRGIKKLKHYDGVGLDGQPKFRMVYAACNTGKKLTKLYKRMRGVVEAPAQKAAVG